MTKDDAKDSELLPFDGEILKTRRATYEVLKLLGRGGFGAVYEIRQRDKPEPHFAAKFELSDVKKQVLSMDCRVLRGAVQIQSPHFCPIVDRGKVSGRFRFMVMKLVGRNLWDLRKEQSESRFSLSTSLKIAEQCLMAIEDLHRIGYLHRDVKPGNFAIGQREQNEQQVVHLLDFGLCRKFMNDDKKQDLRKPRESAPFRGTTRYASLAAHRQQEQARKDDLEAWLYMIVEWTAGSLPWRKLKSGDKNDVLRFKESVREESSREFFVHCPYVEFRGILLYVDSLFYQSIPDYNYVYYCLQHAKKVYKIDSREPLDWDLENKYFGPTKADRDRRIDLHVDEETLADTTPSKTDKHKSDEGKSGKKNSL
ncbi:Tau-tubulin kinase 2 [Aphelenchoides besseyi]|nr:Tau-tubulin kinase 2 [Aphelenchoides besseyi]